MHVVETEPTSGLASYQSFKKVQAGQITEVCEGGCYVRESDGTAVFRKFLPVMTARYQPVVGDYWVVYPGDGYQSISPRSAFEEGYLPTVPASNRASSLKTFRVRYIAGGYDDVKGATFDVGHNGNLTICDGNGSDVAAFASWQSVITLPDESIQTAN